MEVCKIKWVSSSVAPVKKHCSYVARVKEPTINTYFLLEFDGTKWCYRNTMTEFDREFEYLELYNESGVLKYPNWKACFDEDSESDRPTPIVSMEMFPKINKNNPRFSVDCLVHSQVAGKDVIGVAVYDFSSQDFFYLCNPLKGRIDGYVEIDG